MTAPNLAALNKDFLERPRARVVAGLPLQPGGVDPLGMRQINLSLMSTVLPGINNVTSLIRPYVLMAWAWRQAGALAKATGRTEIPTSTLLDFVDRAETIFVWSHMLAEDPAPLPGKSILARGLPLDDGQPAFNFQGADWKALREKRRANTSFMAAVQYGPSIRTSEGLGWLHPVPGGALIPAPKVTAAIEAFHAAVSRSLPKSLNHLEGGPVSPAEARALHSLWKSSEPTEAEKRSFRRIFYDDGLEAPDESAPARRSATLSTIFAALKASKHPLSVKDIRRIIASGRLPDGRSLELPSELIRTHRLLAALQARQLQRVALESLLVWVEGEIHSQGGVVDVDHLVAQAWKRSCEVEPAAKAKTVSDYLDQVDMRGGATGWPGAAGIPGETDIFDLMAQLEHAQAKDRPRLPGLAIRALGYVASMALALGASGETDLPESALAGPRDRLPLDLMVSILQRLSGVSMPFLWREIIESWVLGQHVRWSVARNGDGTQRLRLALDDGGWVRLRTKISGPFRPTPDRLSTALALSAQCDLISHTGTDEALYAVR
jgi:hypothetical protein